MSSGTNRPGFVFKQTHTTNSASCPERSAMSISLEPEAEIIRKQIKQMIPETAIEGEIISDKADRLQSDDGKILYSGSALFTRVVALRKKIKELGDVFLSPHEDRYSRY
ncbi:hypothetical protein BJX99DRAFT_97706 [Aspergillus californicus]